MKKLATLFVTALLLMLAALPLINDALAASNNLIPNPSVETAAGAAPASWSAYKMGTPTSTSSYLTTGHTGSHSLKTQITKIRNGQVGWQFTPVTISPSTKYTYTDWYQSNVGSSVSVIITPKTGSATTFKTVSVPASKAWKQSTVSFTAPANAKAVTIRHYLTKVGQLTTDDFDLEGPTPAAPTVSFTAPANNATVQNTQTITATARNAVGVQFKLDGSNLGAEDTAAPYSVSWNTKTTANGSHTLTATARNTAGVTTTATRTVNVQNIAAPTVNLTAPTANATVSGTATPVTANATNAIGVQFKLDGSNLGAEDTAAPYSVSWNTTTVANGNHTLTAVARNTGTNQSVTSTPVIVNVQNTVVTPPSSPNLIPNSSFETASGSVPANWLSSNWGNNTANFSYLSTGHTGTHSAKVEITAYTDGAANWYYTDVPATVGKTYKYENWYQSNVDTEVDAEIVMNDGTVQYAWLGTVFASANWAKFSTTYTVPTGAKSIAIYQILAKKGYIVSDDYSLSEYTPAPLARGLVSVAFDDGWANQYANALPTLQQLGIKSTFYIISGELNDTPDYMTNAQVKDLFAKGHEIASHSVTHSDMTTLSQTNLVNEFAQSKTTLQNLIGAPVTDFAYPYGAYNLNTINTGKTYYQSQRSVNGGLNTKDNFDITQLKIYEVDSNISQAQVQGWINAAAQQHAWLILLYHEVANTPAEADDALYTAKPADFNAEMAYLKNSGVATVTVNQAINEILSQL